MLGKKGMALEKKVMVWRPIKVARGNTIRVLSWTSFEKSKHICKVR